MLWDILKISALLTALDMTSRKPLKLFAAGRPQSFL
jgi:hypothetical protein